MKFILAFLAYGCCLFTFSQDNKNLVEQYQGYFELPRESLFIHLNKTSFIAGEEVWFKTYAYDRHGSLPSKATTNINVGLYDNSGKLIKNDLWLAVNGSAEGSFAIDSTYASGEYYLRASTNWMKNFEENDAFIQKIRVLANDDQAQSETTTQAFDFQFLPEGGHLVYDVNNSLGFKIINNNGRGVKITGTIYDSNDQEVTNIKSNTFGIGKCLFKPVNGLTYRAEIFLPNGSSISKDIKEIETYGIAIQVNNARPNDVVVNLSTNPVTLSDIGNKSFTLLIHKDGIIKSIPFSFENSDQKTFIIPKADLFGGINILTIIDEKEQPLLERLIFKYPDISKSSPIVLNTIKTENDTISLSLYNLKSKSGRESIQNLSISVLPGSTTSYNPDHSIISATLLKPYLKGHIENPKYYFEKRDNKTQYELDLLLLTQGWSRYNWNSIFNNTPEPVYEFENGVTLKGKINSKKKIDNLRLQQPKLIGYNWMDVFLNKDYTFEIKNYFPIKDEVIRFSYREDGELKKPNLYVNCQLSPPDFFISEKELYNDNQLISEGAQLPTNAILDSFFYKNVVDLDEIIIEAQNNQKKVDNIGVKVNSATFRDNYTQITQAEVDRFPNVLDIIIANGYNAIQSGQFGGVVITRNIRNSINASQSPAVFLDDAPISNYDFLLNLPTADIEGILIDKTGFGLGVNGANGVIRIYTRRTPLNGFNPLDKAFAHTSTAQIGFSTSKVFYNPAYVSYTNEFFMNFGTIGWFPNIELKPNNSTVLEIPNTETEVIHFYIEGFDNNGVLISELKILNISN